jgi:hypothetical protein
MKFAGRIQRNETCGTSIRSMSHGLSKELNRLSIILSHRNTVNFEAQSEIIGFELEITGWSIR